MASSVTLVRGLRKRVRHKPVNVIGQAELRAPLDFLVEHKAPVGTLLARAGLPPSLEEPGGGFLPARHMLAFLAAGAHHLDREDFSFRAVLRAPSQHVGSWGPMLSTCWRLRDALRCFCGQLVRDAPFLMAGLLYSTEHAWLWRSRGLPAREPLAERQGQLFTLGSMLRIVRMVAGDTWTPRAIVIDSHAPDWLLDAERLGSDRIHLNDSVLAIGIPYSLLDRRVRPQPRHETSTVVEASIPPAPSDFSESLLQALLPLVGSKPLSLEIGAEIAETSPRTLRRWLKCDGTSWKGIRDRVYFEAAEKLMLDPSRTLANIADELGYSDQAHLTRAFRRWTGETPSAYRHRRSSATEQGVMMGC